MEIRSFSEITNIYMARRSCVQETAAWRFIKACACDMIVLFIILSINQIKYGITTSFDVPHVNSVLICGYEGLLVGTYAYWVELFFFARLVSLQVLSDLLDAVRFWFRHHEAFASLKHFHCLSSFFFVLVFDCEELHVSCCSSQEQWPVCSIVIQPLNTLDTLRNVLRMQNIKAFCLGLKFCQIIKICSTFLILDPFKKNDSPTAIAYRQYVSSCVEWDCRQ